MGDGEPLVPGRPPAGYSPESPLRLLSNPGGSPSPGVPQPFGCPLALSQLQPHPVCLTTPTAGRLPWGLPLSQGQLAGPSQTRVCLGCEKTHGVSSLQRGQTPGWVPGLARPGLPEGRREAGSRSSLGPPPPNGLVPGPSEGSRRFSTQSGAHSRCSETALESKLPLAVSPGAVCLFPPSGVRAQAAPRVRPAQTR